MQLLFPTCLAEETELLEALDWDEEALADIILLCQSSFEDITSEAEVRKTLEHLYATLTKERNEQIAKLVISFFIKKSLQLDNKEIEA